MQVQDSPALLPELSGLAWPKPLKILKIFCLWLWILHTTEFEKRFFIAQKIECRQPLVSLIQNFADHCPCSSPAACQSLPHTALLGAKRGYNQLQDNLESPKSFYNTVIVLKEQEQFNFSDFGKMQWLILQMWISLCEKPLHHWSNALKSSFAKN